MVDHKDSKGFRWTVLSLLGVCLILLVGLQIIMPANTVSRAPQVVAAAMPVSQSSDMAETSQAKADQPDSLHVKSGLSVKDLRQTFNKLDYRLDDVLQGEQAVPRLFLASLPHDLKAMKQVEERKSVFFRSLLPLVLKINEEIRRERARVLRLHHRVRLGLDIVAEDRIWLSTVFERYGVEDSKFDELLRRMDVVPPSLALAQAAEESGWGTSRFVREGNALFGQWTFDPNDKGIVPSQRADGKSHRIRAFDSIKASLQAYVHNLNTHKAYRKLRQKRANLRAQRQPVGGAQLATTLDKYSERGEHYVASLQAIIEANQLHQFDDTTLADEMLVATSEKNEDDGET
jgi:Bax protein